MLDYGHGHRRGKNDTRSVDIRRRGRGDSSVILSIHTGNARAVCGNFGSWQRNRAAAHHDSGRQREHRTAAVDSLQNLNICHLLQGEEFIYAFRRKVAHYLDIEGKLSEPDKVHSVRHTQRVQLRDSSQRLSYPGQYLRHQVLVLEANRNLCLKLSMSYTIHVCHCELCELRVGYIRGSCVPDGLYSEVS